MPHLQFWPLLFGVMLLSPRLLMQCSAVGSVTGAAHALQLLGQCSATGPPLCAAYGLPPVRLLLARCVWPAPHKRSHAMSADWLCCRESKALRMLDMRPEH